MRFCDLLECLQIRPSALTSCEKLCFSQCIGPQPDMIHNLVHEDVMYNPLHECMSSHKKV